MTNYRFFISFFILTLLPFNQVNAENWWDKGKEFLKTLEDKKQSADPGINPSLNEISKAFKEALRIGSENVVSQLSAIDGFNKDPAIHIPLPKNLKSVKKVLAKFGMRKEIKDLELKLNRAAEAATPKAKELFLQSINEMTFDDVKSI